MGKVLGLCDIGFWGKSMKLKGELFVFLSATGFALMPVFAKMAYRGGANVTTVLLLRFLFAVIFIWSYIFIKRIDYRIKLKQLAFLMVLGSLCYSGSAITLFNSYRFISAGLSDVFMFTYPVWVLLIARIATKNKMGFNKIIAIALSLIGIIISCYTKNQIFSMKGTVLALLGAVFYAFYVAYLDNSMFKEIHPIIMTGYILIAAGITFLIFGLVKGELVFNFMASSWVYSLLLAFFSTSLSILAFCAGAKLIGSSRAAIISTIEPLITFLFGFLLLKEKFTLNMAIGGLFIISAVICIHLLKDKEKISDV